MAFGNANPPGNFMGDLKSFWRRGGAFNGLNPQVVGRIFYVNGEGSVNYNASADGNSGLTPQNGLSSMARALALVDDYDIIVLDGVIREQVVSPQDVFDVTIIGAANRGRQATDGGVATGGGASWLSPASPTATTPLLKLREQGWTVANIQFAPVASSACIRLSRAETAADMDGSHASILGCYFSTGGANGIGIEDVGGASGVQIADCRFRGLTTAIKGISTGIAVPLGWEVLRNSFLRNTNAIGMSSSQGLFKDNVFNQAANDTNFKMNLVAVAGQGDLNNVLGNFFSDVAANVTIAKGYKPGTTDVWRNFVTDTAAYIVTVPA